MRIKLFFVMSFIVLNLFGQELISSGELSIGILQLTNGANISSLKKNNTELLNLNITSEFFVLTLNKGSAIIPKFIKSSDGWGSINIINNGTNGSITFTNPLDTTLSKNLTVVVTIVTKNKKSGWDILVTGLEKYSLYEVSFPQISIKADGNDYFFLPHYSGQEIKNPKSSFISSDLLYPNGWDASMQFSAYYNNNYGIYFGMHDPKSSLKTFVTRVKDNGLLYANKIPIPNMSKAGNNWEMSGVFCIELFEGNWYEASQIYRNWASKEAEYWPKKSVSKNIRLETLGNIGLWAYAFSTPDESMQQIEEEFSSFAEYFDGIKVGIHWYQWNYLDFDNDYPNYFPELTGMGDLVKRLQKSDSLFIMPYINGRLFDQDLPNYSTDGYPYATKNSYGSSITQNFNGNTFDVMCPTQIPWQNILIDASVQLTDRINCSGIYLDQVCAATPTQCMDVSHQHTLGGGSWWREGYNKMFKRIHNNLLDKKFVTVEGGCDYLADEVDGFLVEGWTSNNLVPAFSAVYAGQVQLIGRATNTSNYHNQAYYCKLSQALSFGIQLGRASTWIVHDSNADIAAPFLKQIATMRYKLRDFLAFGRMLKPLAFDGEISLITSTWQDYGDNIDVTISALQSSVWKNSTNDKVAILLSNASMNKTLNFSFEFNGDTYGLSGKLQIIQMNENVSTTPVVVENLFSRNIVLQPLEVLAFIIQSDSLSSVISEDNYSNNYKLEQNFPNPFNPATTIKYTIHMLETLHATSQLVQLEVYNLLGKKVATLVEQQQKPGNYKVKFNAENYPSGVYYYQLKIGNFVETKKMLLIK